MCSSMQAETHGKGRRRSAQHASDKELHLAGLLHILNLLSAFNVGLREHSIWYSAFADAWLGSLLIDCYQGR